MKASEPLEAELSRRWAAALDDAQAAQALARLLARSRTASLATLDDAGRPHATNVQFAHDAELHCYWVSSPDSAHSRHILQRPAIAWTVYGHDDAPANIHGLQMHGMAQSLNTPALREHAWTCYADKFPELAADPQFSGLIARQSFYRLEPMWLRWIDNRRGFGFRVQWARDRS